MQAIKAAESFLALVDAGPPTPARLTKVTELLQALAAVRWEDASPKDREAGWGLTLHLTLLKQASGKSKVKQAKAVRPSPAPPVTSTST
jgi:hypothetical protein